MQYTYFFSLSAHISSLRSPALCCSLALNVTPHLVLPLALRSEGSVGHPVKAGRHLEGLDVLRGAHATGALGDEACQTHLLQQVDLRSKGSRGQTSQYLLTLLQLQLQLHCK